MDISPQELETCLRVLQQIARDPSVIDNDERMKALVAKIHTQGKKGQRRTAREARVASDRETRATTVLQQKQRERLAITQPLALPAPSPGREGTETASRVLVRQDSCYVCKQSYREVHWFYHRLCPECANFNWEKREQHANLQGRTALITGGRIKIGYEVALRLLRDGARVLLTTRFPQNAVQRFQEEPDFEVWRHNLQIFGLDLRAVPSVEAFANYLLASQPSLDILIHNAAQTVKRPLQFYQHLLDAEQVNSLPDSNQKLVVQNFNTHTDLSFTEANLSSPAVLLEQHPLYPHLESSEAYFPQGTLDADGQQFDARPRNSWRLRLEEISTLEMLEVHLVNAVAPFILNAKLKPLLTRSPHAHRFIINVSAMEGQFARRNKTWFHPHTNMAKAAMNMMTRTSASDFARDKIYMNSVDTGWITDENPFPTGTKIREEQDFYPPLDVIDGAARIYDPIVRGIKDPEEPLFGHFLKDYVSHPW